MAKTLGPTFFDRPTLKVARDLIGCYLCRHLNGKTERRLITETEAYDGHKDLASHAARGRRTSRTEIMYDKAGTIYVYFTYGMHWMLNIVTGPRDYPAAVLIRGIESLNGPARLTKKLHVTGAMNGFSLGKKSGLWIEAGEKIPNAKVKRTSRIGVAFAGPVWSEKKYRFVLKD